MSVKNVEAQGFLVIGGFAKTLADVREFVRLADEFRLPDEQPCNAVLQCRVESSVETTLCGEHMGELPLDALLLLHDCDGRQE